jgi:hypothetical protein
MTKSISIFSNSCKKWRELKNYNDYYYLKSSTSTWQVQLEFNFIFDETLQEK